MHEFVSYFLLLSYWFSPSNGLHEILFLAGSSSACHYDATALAGSRCARRVSVSREKPNQCVESCHRDVACVGVTLDAVDKDFCVVHYECSLVVNASCPLDDAHYSNRRFYSKNCAHDGRWVPSENKCRCAYGWVGVRCQDMPKDSRDLVTSGYPFGIQRTYFDLRSEGLGLVVPVHVFVIPTAINSHIVLLVKHTGNMNFNRSWTDYQEGFFDDSNNFWTGFRTWWALSRAGYSRMFLVLDFKTKGRLYKLYEQVSVTKTADDSYAISLSPSTTAGSGAYFSQGIRFGDCPSPCQGVPFSTFDTDLDGDPFSNTAARQGYGWWFHDTCAKNCNLFGKGPAYWGDTTVPPQQRLFISGVPESLFTAAEFDNFHIYVTV